VRVPCSAEHVRIFLNPAPGVMLLPSHSHYRYDDDDDDDDVVVVFRQLTARFAENQNQGCRQRHHRAAVSIQSKTRRRRETITNRRRPLTMHRFPPLVDREPIAIKVTVGSKVTVKDAGRRRARTKVRTSWPTTRLERRCRRRRRYRATTTTALRFQLAGWARLPLATSCAASNVQTPSWV